MPETMRPREKVELKPCPFCGGTASLHDGVGEFWVRCDHCGSSGSMRSRRDRAERDWNERAALASSGDHAELARLAEAFGPDEKWTASGNSVALSVDGLYACVAEANPEGAFSDDHAARIAAFIAAANPATALALLAEVAALRAQVKYEKQVAYDENDRWRETDRKLAEATGLLCLFQVYAQSGQHFAYPLGSLQQLDTFLSKEAERG